MKKNIYINNALLYLRKALAWIRDFMKKFYKIFPFLLAAIGLFQSFRQTFISTYFSSDVAAFNLIIQGLHEHGTAFLHDFKFGPPNWFFTVIAPYDIIFHFIGNTPSHILLIGIITFWLTAILVGFIVAYITTPQKGIWAAAITLCAPQTALGLDGLLTNPAAHNVSTLWGLAALLSYLIWIEKGHPLSLLGGIGLLSLSTFSDPWLLPTFDLPLACSALICIIYSSKQKDSSKKELLRWYILLFSTPIIILLCKTHFLGNLYIGESKYQGFTKISFSIKGLINIFRSISYYLNIIPFWNPKNIELYLHHRDKKGLLLSFSLLFINSLLFLSFFLYSFYRTIFSEKRIDRKSIFVTSFFFFSIAGILLSSWSLGLLKEISSSRYLVNVYFSLIIVAFSYKYSERYLPKAMLTCGVFFLFANIISNRNVFYQKTPDTGFTQSTILSVMKDENIDDAYGTYWGTEANALTFINKDKKYIRPIEYDGNYKGFHPGILTSPSWYQPPHKRTWLLVLNAPYNIASPYTVENCPPFPSCEDAARNQFGTPKTILYRDRITFLIYNTAQTDHWIDPHQEAWKTPLPISPKILRKWVKYIPSFTTNRNDLITLDGWDTTRQGIRTIAPYADISAPFLPTYQQPHATDIRIHIIATSTTLHTQRVDIEYEGKIIAQWLIGPRKAPHTFHILVNHKKASLDWKIHILDADTRKESNPPSSGKEGIVLHEVDVEYN